MAYLYRLYFFGLTAGGIFIATEEPTYESKMSFVVNTIPPFITDELALSRFQKEFYTEGTFNKWKENQTTTALKFDDFSPITVIDGYRFSKNHKTLLAVISLDKQGEPRLILRTNHLDILDDFYKYANYVAELMRRDYIDRAVNEMEIISSHLNRGQPTVQVPMLRSPINDILEIDRYLDLAKTGASVISIRHPTFPFKVYPIASLCLVFHFY